MFWDFLTLRQECTHTTLIFFSDRGIPESFRKMHGFGVNTYAFVNAEGKFNYCKFHWLSNQGKEKYKTHCLNFFFHQALRGTLFYLDVSVIIAL